MSIIEIRPVSEHDAEEIARLGEKRTRQWRIEPWEERIAYAARPDPEASLVALAENLLTADLFTDVRGPGYGFPEKTDWIEAIGADPHCQKQTEVIHIRTLVSAHQSQLLRLSRRPWVQRRRSSRSLQRYFPREVFIAMSGELDAQSTRFLFGTVNQSQGADPIGVC